MRVVMQILMRLFNYMISTSLFQILEPPDCHTTCRCETSGSNADRCAGFSWELKFPGTWNFLEDLLLEARIYW